MKGRMNNYNYHQATFFVETAFVSNTHSSIFIGWNRPVEQFERANSEELLWRRLMMKKMEELEEESKISKDERHRGSGAWCRDDLVLLDVVPNPNVVMKIYATKLPKDFLLVRRLMGIIGAGRGE